MFGEYFYLESLMRTLIPFREYFSDPLSSLHETVFAGADQEAIRVLRRAIMSLRVYHPFYATILNNLKMTEDRHISTMCTDGQNIRYNPGFVLEADPANPTERRLKHEHIMFIICHEIMHCVWAHFARMGDRDLRKWNIATDYAINQLLENSIFTSSDDNPRGKKLPAIVPPPGVLLNSAKFGGKGAEQIYEMLTPEDMPENQGKGKGQKGNKGQPGQGQGQPGEPGEPGEGEPGQGGGQPGQGEPQGVMPGDEKWNIGGVESAPEKVVDENGKEVSRKELEKEWQEAVKKAINQSAGSPMGTSAFDEWLKGELKPKVDWKSKLQNYMRISLKKERFQPWKARFVSQGMYVPGMKNSEELGNIVIAVDVSGSMGDEQKQRIMSEIKSIIKTYRINNLDVVYFDTQITHVSNFKNPTSLRAEKVPVGGGTDFQCVYNWIKQKHNNQVDLLMIATDGFPNYWPPAPLYKDKMIFLIIDQPQVKPNCGKTIYVDSDSI